MHGDPIGDFITWSTYGTWLPGDGRGWIEYKLGWRMPDPVRELEARAKMAEDVCLLVPSQRLAVEAQIAETCGHRGWMLHAVNCRSNHVHAVVSADVPSPKKIRVDLKAWATRCLKALNPDRENWWAERCSIRYLNGQDSLCDSVFYVVEGQDLEME